VVRKEAQAISQTELLPTELITVVLSESGWIRAAKGHEIDAGNLSYKSGDAFKIAVTGKSNQQAVFIDSTGRSYSLPAHTLPSARGQGEPLTGRLNSPPGANFAVVLLGEESQKILLASNNGYGFITTLSELYCKNKNGKAVLKLSDNAVVLRPCLITNLETDLMAAITNTGQLLIFSVKDLPELPRGKGNKILNVPSAKFKKGEETIADIAVLSNTQNIKIYSGKQHLILKPSDWKNFIGKRAERGGKLPRGFQRVERVLIETA